MAALPIGAQDGGTQARGEAKRVVEPVRVGVATDGVVVDGRLEEAVWKAATPIRLEWEVNPRDNVAARALTVCRLAHDATHLYFGCDASDADPSGIRAYLTDRDRTEGQDRIFLTLDPFADSRRGFEFGVTPLGVQHDRLRTEAVRQNEDSGTPGLDDAWDAIWESAGRIVPGGYVVEAAIPFRSLRFPSLAENEEWRFFITREWPRAARTWFRSVPWDRSDPCLLCQSNTLAGLSGLVPGMNLEINPTVTADRIDVRAGRAPGLTNEAVRLEAGLDARWSPAPNLALNVTANPDFSQIDADVAQLEANIRFPLLFPEKRPFFLEGADLFETPVRAVFTRSIADPVAGLKLSGKFGKSALGVLAARDAVTNLIVPAHATSDLIHLEQDATTLIARARRDLGASSNVGVLYTGRMGHDYRNHVFGADALVRPLPSTTARIQFLGSSTADPDVVSGATDRNGNALHATFEYRTREWAASFIFDQRSPGFRADAGFVAQADVRSLQAWINRSFWSDGNAWFTRLAVNGGYWQETDWANTPGIRGVWMNATYDGPAQSFVYVNPNFTRQTWSGTTHDLTTIWFGASLRPSGTVELGLAGVAGSTIDYENGVEVDLTSVAPQVALRLGRHLDLRASHSLQRLRRDGQSVLDATVSEIRTVYSFTARAFMRGIVQYRDTERPEVRWLQDATRDRRVDVQFLFSYKFNPLTVFHVGYGGAWSDDPEISGPGRDVVSSRRAFFVKLGYAWRP